MSLPPDPVTCSADARHRVGGALGLCYAVAPIIDGTHYKKMLYTTCGQRVW